MDSHRPVGWMSQHNTSLHDCISPAEIFDGTTQVPTPCLIECLPYFTSRTRRLESKTMYENQTRTVAKLRERVENLLSEQRRSRPSCRVLIALAGVPGSGKSTIAATLIDDLKRHGVDEVAILPMVRQPSSLDDYFPGAHHVVDDRMDFTTHAPYFPPSTTLIWPSSDVAHHSPLTRTAS